MEYTKELILDLNAYGDMPVVVVKQCDRLTRFLAVQLQKDGEDYTPDSGYSVRFRCRKPDGRKVSYPCTMADGTVTIELSEQVAIVPGKCFCDICFTKGEFVISTLPFSIDVRPSPGVGKVVSTDDIRD